MKRIKNKRLTEREVFRQSLNFEIKDKLTEQGANGSRVYEDGEDLTGFRLIDEWETDEDLQSYFSKEGFS